MLLITNYKTKDTENVKNEKYMHVAILKNTANVLLGHARFTWNFIVDCKTLIMRSPRGTKYESTILVADVKFPFTYEIIELFDSNGNFFDGRFLTILISQFQFNV